LEPFVVGKGVEQALCIQVSLGLFCNMSIMRTRGAPRIPP
jgi:hypothetical protein